MLVPFRQGLTDSTSTCGSSLEVTVLKLVTSPFFLSVVSGFSPRYTNLFQLSNAVRVPGIDSNDRSVIDVLLQRFLGFLSLLTITSHLDSRHFLSLCCGTLQT